MHRSLVIEFKILKGVLSMKSKKGAAILMSGVILCGTVAYPPLYGGSISNIAIMADAANLTANDDYPQEYKNLARDAVVDKWNFLNRECTSFVAWCLNSRNGVAFTNQYGGVDRWGNASAWGGVAKNLGIAVDMNPAPGSVWWSSNGHVAWVREVNGSSCVIEEYNWDGDGLYHIRERPISSATGYIHIKDMSSPIYDNMTTPTITIPKTAYTLGETVSLSWQASSGNSNLSHYWISVYTPGGTNDIQQRIEPPTTTASFAPKTLGEYTITISATPKGSVEGEGSLTNTVKIIVSDAQFKGNGTADSPYQISSADDLRKLADLINDENTASYYRTKHYTQTADIDLGGEEFTPIGTRLVEGSAGGGFSGVYDGKYHKVTGIKVDRAMPYNGLFGWCYGGTIQNVSAYGSIKGRSPVGGIVGELGTTTLSSVKNCSFNGDIISTTGSAGGIVGHIWESGYVENSYFNGTLLSQAEKTENANTGGIIGTANIGNEGGGAPITVKNCYAVPSGKAKGGIIGQFNLVNSASTVTLENNFFLKTTAANGIVGDVSKGCSGLTDELMKSSAAELLGDPFVLNDDTDLNNGYPVFSWQAPAYKFQGEGTEESPYLINSKADLEAFRDIMNNELQYSSFYKSYFKLTTDIDLGGKQWTPIAKRYFNEKDAGMYFCGYFDGGNHTITGLNVSEKSKFAGLFGSIAGGGVIENLAVEGKVVNTTLSTGGIVGEICSGNAIVRNCCFIGDVTGADQAVGGVVGYLWQKGTIQNCYHIGTVTCPDHTAGGVVGKAVNETENSKAIIENCYHVGKITGLSGTIVGGVGESVADGAIVEVINCFGLTTDGTLCGTGEIKTFDAMQCTESVLKKSAALLGDAFVTDSDNSNNGYPIFVWQDKNAQAPTSEEIYYGDTNLDGKINVSDAVAILQFIANKEKYPIKQQGLVNADVDGATGITGSDAIVIQQVDAGVVNQKDLPLKQ